MTNTIKAANTPADLTAENVQATLDVIRAQGAIIEAIGKVIERDGHKYVSLGGDFAIQFDGADSDDNGHIQVTPEDLQGLPDITPQERIDNLINAAIAYDLTIEPLMLSLHLVRMAYFADVMHFGEGNEEQEVMNALVVAHEGGEEYIMNANLNYIFSDHSED